MKGKRMFNNKQYYEINREERFYCFLFAHALLSSHHVRSGFARLVERRFKVILDPDDLEVYVEAAVLRDFWHDLGDPNVYSDKTHLRRRKVLEAILNEFDVPASTLEAYDLFWTTGERNKLWSPGRWSEGALKQNGLENIIPVKWAFNAKPDIMVFSGNNVLLIEAKVESGEGRDGQSGYQQFENQQLVSRLIKLLVPQFRNSTIANTVLELKSVKGISWDKVVSIVRNSDVDKFTKNCLSQIQRFNR